MSLKIIKLLNNEEVMGEIQWNSEGDCEITNPVRIQVMPGKTGEPQIGFAPWPMFADHESKQKFIVSSLSVIYQYSPAQELINNYNSVFGSGIVLPPTKQIITG
jgi:hypothetical protein